MNEIIFDDNGNQVPVIQLGDGNPNLAKFLDEKLKIKPGNKNQGRQTKLTDALKNEILEARNLGFNNEKIAKLLDIGKSTVSLYIKRMKSEGYNVATQEKRQRKSVKTKYNNDAKVKLAELYNNGCSVREIAKAMGVSEQTVYNYQFYMRSEGYVFGEDSVVAPTVATTDLMPIKQTDITTNVSTPATIKKTTSTVSKEELVLTLGGFTVKISSK
jgi:transposase